jgi:hypothetical protein
LARVAPRKFLVNEVSFQFRNCEKETVVKKVLVLMMALGLLVAFTSVSVAMGICGGPKVQAQANADSTNMQQNDQIVVAQAEMTEDTSPATDEESTEEEDTESN